MSLAKLTSVSTQTLSLLLERQRLQTFSPNGGASTPTLHTPQIARNLRQLRVGVLALEAREGRSEAAGLLRNQYERMRAMLGPAADAEGVESLLDEDGASLAPIAPNSAAASTSSLGSTSSTVPSKARERLGIDDDAHFAPYADDPERGPEPEPATMVQMQRQTMEDQDVHLDHLSRSINRQRDISLQINDELDTHTGLLEELDHDLDGTQSRLSNARKRLDRFAKGVKGNGSTATIALLILVLLILIVIFKT